MSGTDRRYSSNTIFYDENATYLKRKASRRLFSAPFSEFGLEQTFGSLPHRAPPALFEVLCLPTVVALYETGPPTLVPQVRQPGTLGEKLPKAHSATTQAAGAGWFHHAADGRVLRERQAPMAKQAERRMGRLDARQVSGGHCAHVATHLRV